MTKLLSMSALALALVFPLGLGACTDPYSPGQRAVGGGVIGGLGGAGIGALAGGGKGALIGGLAGSALAPAPAPRRRSNARPTVTSGPVPTRTSARWLNRPAKPS